MSNVISLVTTRVETNQDCLSLLEELVERVKEGEIVEIAIACVTNTGASVTANTLSQNAQYMIGSIEILKQKLINGVLE
jgi:recombinational DNA repair protein RecR